MTSSEKPTRLKDSLILPVIFVALIWLVKLVETIFKTDFSDYGLHPLHADGLLGIITAPLLHGDYQHLFSNSIPLLVLGTAIFQFYRRVAFEVIGWIYFATGVWVWLAADSSVYHIGASGIVYGFAFFVLFAGIFRKDAKSIALALLVVFLYGSLFWGLFPLYKNVSFESHIYGAVSGIMCAWFYRGVDLPSKRVWTEEDEQTDLPWDQFEDPLGGEINKSESEERKSGDKPEENGFTVRYIYKEKE